MPKKLLTLKKINDWKITLLGMYSWKSPEYEQARKELNELFELALRGYNANT